MKQSDEVQEMQMQAGAEPEEFNLSYSFSLKNIFCFNLPKKCCSEA